MGALILAPTPALATTASSNLVLVRESDVVSEDLYASGNRVIVRGVVEGDLVASAFESVIVVGRVEGDVLAVAGVVDIQGEVAGSVRAIADRVSVSGQVGGDVSVAARRLVVSGDVDNDVLTLNGSAAISGTIGRDVRMVSVDEATVSGRIDRDLEHNGSLRVADGASIGADLRYRGDGRIGDVDVGGTSIALGDPPTPVRIQALVVVAGVVGLLGLLAIGFVAMWLMPRTAEQALLRGRVRAWPASLLVGLLALGLPLGVFAAFLAGGAAVSSDLLGAAFILASPILMGWIGVAAATLLVGLVPVSAAFGGSGRSAFAQYILGVVVILITLLAIGLVAGLLWAAALWLMLSVIGAGAWVRGAWAGRGSLAWAGPTAAPGT